MPVATVTTDYVRYDLKSLDEAFVCIRPLPYGKKLEVQERAMRMTMTGLDGNEEDFQMGAEFANKATRAIEFTFCIGDHNLEDVNGRKLDLSAVRTLDILDPRVGEEIGNLLDKVNGEEVDADLFMKQPSLSLTDEATS